MGCPAFFNMLIKIAKNQETIDALGEESLLLKFVEVAKYFNPDD